MHPFLEKYLKSNFPDDRVPTVEECIYAIEHPQTTEPWVKEYIRLHPELEKNLRSILELD